MAYRTPAGGKAEASPITFGLFSRTQVDRRKIRDFDLEGLVLMNGRPAWSLLCGSQEHTPRFGVLGVS